MSSLSVYKIKEKYTKAISQVKQEINTTKNELYAQFEKAKSDRAVSILKAEREAWEHIQHVAGDPELADFKILEGSPFEGLIEDPASFSVYKHAQFHGLKRQHFIAAVRNGLRLEQFENWHENYYERDRYATSAVPLTVIASIDPKAFIKPPSDKINAIYAEIREVKYLQREIEGGIVHFEVDKDGFVTNLPNSAELKEAGQYATHVYGEDKRLTPEQQEEERRKQAEILKAQTRDLAPPPEEAAKEGMKQAASVAFTPQEAAKHQQSYFPPGVKPEAHFDGSNS